MTPREALARVEGLGYCLGLRPGGLRLSGEGEAPPEVLGLIREHRDGLLALLEEDAQRCAAHDASLAAGRVTDFPGYLAHLVDPAALLACRDAEAERKTRRKAALDARKGHLRAPFLPQKTRSNPRRC